jgi:uncharacterized repeat protein (TIGR03803 family)
LIDVNGTLYGTTSAGGSGDDGTVFSVRTTGKFHVLHRFSHGTDGSNPAAGLIDVKGTLYGTTSLGGSHRTGYYFGFGTVFSIATDGTEQVLHSFGHGSDGRHPEASLLDVNGTLYGTTYAGGAGSGCSDGCGTVFSVSTSGKESVLHRFGDGSDGAFPVAGLVDVKGTLYGTTEYGGTDGEGTVFSISTSGTEKILHNFVESDGEIPRASPINVNGTLYGTTWEGGKYGAGTVFSISTSGAENVCTALAVAQLVDSPSPAYSTSMARSTAQQKAVAHPGTAPSSH